MPGVFSAPIRDDIVQFVHSEISKNRRQAHGVSKKAGHQTSAESWGTGRAVARIPRVGGSGTSRSGQGAFGNMCRGGHMFSPLKTYRRWHRRVNLKQKRHALATAVAATGVTPLVLARGHRVLSVPEVPLVLDKLNAKKTTNLTKILERFGLKDDMTRSKNSKKTRAGIGKLRNRRYVIRRGPLVIYGDESKEVKQAAKNIPGLEVAHVNRLNLLKLAPGGHLGRLCVWTADAFKALNNVFGTTKRASAQKKGYKLQKPVMNCADLARLINSDQVQSKIRGPKKDRVLHNKKKNPLTNKAMMKHLNPFNEQRQKQEAALQAERTKKRKQILKEKRKNRAASLGWIKSTVEELETAYKKYDPEAAEEEEEEEEEVQA